ncbi:phosphatase PAP2 family protein, partial [Klebsiella pneumoniae]
PPPAVGSIAFLNDQAMYEQGRLLRNTERGKLAAEDANLSAGGVANAFSSAFGSPITEKDAPQLHKLLTNMIEDAGDLATRSAKEKYMRIRPFAFYGVSTCNTTEQDKLAKNGSYPSGHTSIGWATALVLAEINPQR